MSTPWKGVFPAIQTPTDDNGRLLAGELAEQVRILRAGGADGVMALGSTGEFLHLDPETRRQVLRVIAETAPGWPILANISEISLSRVAELGRYARAVEARAVSLLPPWFYAMAEADVAEFLVRGAEAAGLPLVLYNYPERTGHRLSLETIAAVCDRVPVAGIKQSGEEFHYHRDLAELGRSKGFTLITGSDVRIPEAYALGARGVVSGLANAVPEFVVGAFQAVDAGNPAAAEMPTARLRAILAAVSDLEFPLNMAAAARARGREIGVFKAPLSSRTRQVFDEAVGAVRNLLISWGMT